MSRLVISLLGPPRIECGGAPIEPETRKAVALLAYLALTAERHSRDALAALFWPESSQAHARGALRYTLASLKKALGDDWLAIDRETISLRHDDSIWLDVAAFRRRLDECRTHGHSIQEVCSACLTPLTDSVAVYHDHFMAGFTLRDSPSFDEWQFFEGERLRSELASALERLARCHMTQAQWEPAIDCGRRWVALDPLHEPAQRLLMQVYVWAGQRAAALRQYDECARVVAQELGAAPSEETAQLYAAIKERRLEPLPAKMLPQRIARVSETETPSLPISRSERAERSSTVEPYALAAPIASQALPHLYWLDSPTVSHTTNGHASDLTTEAAAPGARPPIARRWIAIGTVVVLLALVVVLASSLVNRSSADSGAVAAATVAVPTLAPATADSGGAPAATAVAASPLATRTPATTPATVAPAAAATPAPTSWRGQGGMLRIAIPKAPESLNSHQTDWAWDGDAARLILEPLAAIGPDGSPIPVLAAEIPTIANGGVAKDFMSVTWKLKQGITWSDGSAFTASDVVFTYQYCANEQTACSDSYAFAEAAKVEALDPATVKITWRRPTPYPYRMFAGLNGAILQKQQFGACVGARAKSDPACQRANRAPIGTGPYKLRAFNSSDGDVVVYDINEHYRDPNRPFFREVRITVISDYIAAARAVFESGTADFAPYLVPVDAAILKPLIEIGKGEWLVAPTSFVERLVLNRANPDPALGDKRSEPDQPHPFLSDPRVRRALALAIDRQAIAEQVYRMGLPMSPSCEMVVTEPYIAPRAIYGGRHRCDPDIEGARKLLDAAGWTTGADGIRRKHGVRMTIVYQTSILPQAPPVRQKVQELVKAAWEQLGIEVQTKGVNYQAFFSDDANNPETVYHFYADVEEFANGYDYPDPANYLCGWSSDQIARKSNNWSGSNLERFASAEYDLLCARLSVETDPAKRRELVLRMNDILVEDVVVIPLGTSGGNLAAAYARRISGIDIDPWDSVMWNIADWVEES
jgi:peptide/nickel transport system substrate-binding protein